MVLIGGKGRKGMSYETLVEHFDRAQQMSAVGSWEWDLVSDEVLWSAQIYRIFGLDAADFLPTYAAFLERVYPADRAMVEAGVKRALNGAADNALDHRIVRPDGEIRVVHEQAQVDCGPDGRPRRMVGAILDVTELRATEAAARRNEQMMAAMLRISPEAIVATDQDARIFAFSAGAEEIFGYRAEEIVGQPVEVLLPQRFREDHRRHLDGFAEGSTPSLRMHDRAAVMGRRKSGEEFPAEASLAKLETAEGVAFTAIVRDLSAQKAAELRLIEAREQAERANLAKSTFLANMSHEIRTPLNGVLGVAGALARTELAPRQRDMLRLIESSGRALEGLLSDILDLAKVDAGRMTLRDEPFDLVAVVAETIELFRASAAEKGVALNLVMGDCKARWFRGDDLKIRQVLSNLLSNAVKFTACGEVRLSVSVEPGGDGAHQARFSVRDSGIGFAPEMAQRIFQRFEQADGSVTRRFGGTGLGLAISRSLVNLMGGSISATSAPGRGATFKFEIPLRPDQPATQQPAAAPGRAQQGAAERLRLLLVEDHVVNRLTVELILEDLPVDITAVENGLEGVEAYSSGAYDLILMDMQMPVMDGLAATRRIRSWEAESGRRRTPICMLTANAMDDHRQSASEAGADGFITKPINADDLIRYVTQMAAQKSSDERAA